MDSSLESDANAFENTPLTPRRIGIVAGLFDAVAFTIIGYLVMETPEFGAFGGLALGFGIYLSLPVILSGQDLALSPSLEESPVRRFHRLAAGYGLSAGGMLIFVWGFIEGDLVTGITAGALAAVVVYLIAGFAFPNLEPRE